jgi:AcrR family transcriptional regulator
MAAVGARRRRTPRLQPHERRRQLLDAALEVAEADGFDAVTVAAVVKRAGVTRPVLYDLFGDLDGLLLALIEREEERALAVLAEVVVDDPGARDPDAYLVTAVARLLDAVSDEPRTWRLVLLPPQGSPPALRDRIADSRAAVTARVESLLDWGLAVRGGPAGLDHPVLAHLLVAAGEDAARLVLSHPRRFTPARLTAAARGFVALVPPSAAVLPGRPAQEGTSLPAWRAEMCPPRREPAGASAPAARMPQAQRREQLLDVTLELLARDGFEALSVEAVARAAEVDRVVVYRSFASLHVLLGALLLREQRRIEAALDAVLPRDPTGRPPAEVLVTALDGLLAAVAADPLTWRLALAPAESAPVALRALVERRRNALERRVRRLVAWGVQGLDAGAGPLDVEVLARMILSLAEQSGRLLLDGAYPPQRLRAAAATLLAAAPWVSTTEGPDQK